MPSILEDGRIGHANRPNFYPTYRSTISFLPWHRFVARFFFLTAAIPFILTTWASCIQLNTLAFSKIGVELPSLKIWLSYLFMAIEFMWSLDALLLAFVKATTSVARWRPRLRLLGDNVPSVNVMIPVCNEHLDIIQDTVRATLNINYPRHRFRVIVSDDGGCDELRDWVAQQSSLGVQNLYYTARVKHGSAGYKAGNLNHAMEFAKILPGGQAEYVAGLDADMIPERRWLRAVAAHIVRDSKLSMVCPTQLFYNTPHNDSLYQSSAMNWLCMDMVRDFAGAGWNLGSGWIIRQEAVDGIGGFPTDCLVEDVCSSMLMLADGWKTAYIAEGLQYGLVPETYLGHVKQFTRWVVILGAAKCQSAFAATSPKPPPGTCRPRSDSLVSPARRMYTSNRISAP
ncbi:nucleotide-diphospho-sugar transferase [Lasiosphaeria hispida]|uniref:Nucleotide-diphospho-sugar transferase n=1 Tax=Lasiosphaeria hispida TaxID=260671 RepID=A0AAJ0HKT2_9PEZI|nr:nucleotide-diphospho-sugar transferase [Lasiosphaeria hispida]